jgi:hypothetical protein
VGSSRSVLCSYCDRRPPWLSLFSPTSSPALSPSPFSPSLSLSLSLSHYRSQYRGWDRRLVSQANERSQDRSSERVFPQTTPSGLPAPGAFSSQPTPSRPLSRRNNMGNCVGGPRTHGERPRRHGGKQNLFAVQYTQPMARGLAGTLTKVRRTPVRIGRSRWSATLCIMRPILKVLGWGLCFCYCIGSWC